MARFSDADVEDNLESETSRLHIASSKYESNLSTNAHAACPAARSAGSSNLMHHRHSGGGCGDSEGEASASDLPIKTGTVKENHILPPEHSQSGDSQPASLDSSGTSGIKDDESREIEKLANGISNLELDNAGSERTLGGAAGPRLAKLEPNHVDHHGGRAGGEDAADALVNHCDPKGVNSAPPGGEGWQGDSAVDPATRRNGGEVDKESLLLEGATGREKDAEEKLTLVGGDTTTTSATGGSGGGCLLPNAADKRTSVPNHIAGKPVKESRRDARYRSKTTLAPRYQPSSKECSVMSCLHQFTAAELLTGSNKVSCKMCTKLRPKNAIPHKGMDGVHFFLHV